MNNYFLCSSQKSSNKNGKSLWFGSLNLALLKRLLNSLVKYIGLNNKIFFFAENTNFKYPYFENSFGTLKIYACGFPLSLPTLTLDNSLNFLRQNLYTNFLKSSVCLLSLLILKLYLFDGGRYA